MTHIEVIERAVNTLFHDGLIVYPTDTVYGLGGDALSEEAILKVYEAKGREYHKPISIAVCDPDMIATVGYVDEITAAFIEEFLPGPVTPIIKARGVLPRTLLAGTGKIGIRYPANDTALEIIRKFDTPITSTSANMSGGPNPIVVADCRLPYDFAVDIGPLPGTPSTIVDLVEKEIVRFGPDVENIGRFLAEWA